MTAQQIVEEARDYSATFDYTNVNDKAILRRLSRAQEDLMTDLAQIFPGVILEEGAIPQNNELDEDGDEIPGSGWEGSLELNATRGRPTGITVPKTLVVSETIRVGLESGTSTLDSAPVGLVSKPEQYERGSPTPSVAFTKTNADPDMSSAFLSDLRILGASVHGWDEFSGPLTYEYVPFPVALTTLDQPLTADPGLRKALVMDVAQWMAIRERDMQFAMGIREEKGLAVEAYIKQVSVQEEAIPWIVSRGR